MPVSKTEQAQVIAFLENSQDIDVARESFNDVNLKNIEIIQGGVKDAIGLFSHRSSPHYLIIDISKSDLPVSDLSRLSELCEPGMSVLAIGNRNDVGLYRDLMKLGIFEYLVSPLFSEILTRAIKSMVFGEDKGKATQTKTGKIIVFAGSRGGVGSTFLATNFASILSVEKSRRSVVLDLDLYFGTVSLYFDLRSNIGLSEILENPDRMDELFIERLLIPINERLFILSSETPLDEQIKYKIEGFDILLKYLTKNFHYVIIDVPHSPNLITQKVFANAHIMVLVTDPSLAGLRDSGRLLTLFGTEGAGRRTILVMNKYGAYGKSEVKLADFEQALNHKLNYVIPFDNFYPMDCINQGKNLAEQDTPIAQSLRKIVDDIVGLRPPEESSRSFFNLFRKKN
jgi:pilus assembly protein CpaE